MADDPIAVCPNCGSGEIQHTAGQPDQITTCCSSCGHIWGKVPPIIPVRWQSCPYCLSPEMNCGTHGTPKGIARTAECALRCALQTIGSLRDQLATVTAERDQLAASSATKRLEDWKNGHKRRAVNIEHDDGYGASCWVVELVHEHGGTAGVEVCFWEGDPIRGVVHAARSSDGDRGGLAATIHAALDAFDRGEWFDPKKSSPPSPMKVERDQLRAMAGLLETTTGFDLPNGKVVMQVADGWLGSWSKVEYPTALAAIRAGMGWDREEGT